MGMSEPTQLPPGLARSIEEAREHPEERLARPGCVHQVSGTVQASSGTEDREPTVAERMAAAGYDPEAILADPSSGPVARMIAEINIGVRDRGERWTRCAGCGLPYQITEEWQDGTVCSQQCMQAVAASIRNQAFGGPGL